MQTYGEWMRSNPPIQNLTAVEWFFRWLNDNPEATHKEYAEAFEQAKQMEKEQIIDAHIEGQRVFDKHPHTQWTNDQAEQYYNQTYKNK